MRMPMFPQTLVPAESVVCGFLSQNLPVGLYRSHYGLTDEVLFWLVQTDEGGKSVIVQGDERHLFDVWPLDQPNENWTLIRIAAVELCLKPADLELGSWVEGRTGDIVLLNGHVCIRAVAPNDGFRRGYNLKVGEYQSAADPRQTFIAKTWSLVGRDMNGKPFEVFRRAPDA